MAGRASGLGLITLIVLALTPADGVATPTYPASTGDDVGCDFSVAGAYLWNTDTGVMGTPGGDTPAGTVEGTLRVLNCTTLSIPAGVTLGITGIHAPDLRATGAIQINGTIDVSAAGVVRGPGILNSGGATAG